MRYRVQYTLRQWRNLRGKTLKEVGKAVGVSAVTIHKWETGKGEPKASQIAKLEQVLNFKWSDDIKR